MIIPTPLLDKVKFPADMRGFSDAELKTLADELRQETISAVSKTGGHLGAGLGVVELTVALHAVFNTPEDRLIWDVGHQAYPHKILTGRRDKIRSLRTPGGLAGFTKRAESEYDPFGAGHSSTSISAALGMAVARDKAGKENEVIAVIGDGAMSAGMAFEALNNAGSIDTKLIVILNDNDMSIAPPTGALSAYLSRTLTSQPYISLRNVAKRVLSRFPEKVQRAARKTEQYAKNLASGGNLFEELGFMYIGPIDGHNLDHLLPVLRNVRDKIKDHPVLIHVVTEKGHGFNSPEASSEKYHAVKTFDLATKVQSKGKPGPKTYTQAFAHALIAEAQADDKIIGITAAMPSGTGIDEFGAAFPDRTYDVGIAEQHAVTFAAGLAAEGYKPFCAIYSTFLQRAYDQVVHDVAIQSLPVRFAMDRAGLVGADGPTHAGSFDITYLCTLPNFIVMAASDEVELCHMVATAAAIDDRPSAFRYPRGEGSGLELPAKGEILEIGKGRIIPLPHRLRGGQDFLNEPQASLENPEGVSKMKAKGHPPLPPPQAVGEKLSVALLSFGARLPECLKAAETLEKKGVSVTVADARFAKPLDEALIRTLAKSHELLITIEEGSIGGFGAHVLDLLTREGLLENGLKVRSLHLPDEFQDHGKPEQMYADAGLDAAGIVKVVEQLYPLSRVRERDGVSASG